MSATQPPIEFAEHPHELTPVLEPGHTLRHGYGQDRVDRSDAADFARVARWLWPGVFAA